MTTTTYNDKVLEITAPEVGVQVTIRNDRKVLWVNVDNRCVLRIQDVPMIEVVDERS